ncbi:MAG: Sir2 family NAD-dependent protein deacetylase [Egibacteraceae bacterium]
MSADALADLLADARAGVAFTGAGVSTESGIPDFRSSEGLWTREDPRDLSFRRYVASAALREEAWRRRYALWQDPPRPNLGHLALADLEAAGHLAGVVTQNVDGLHGEAGSATVVELHGSTRRVACIGDAPRAGTPQGCGFSASHTWAFARLEAGEADPRCPDCGGIVKTTTVSFGQNLWPGVLEEATALLDRADLVLVVGSSLAVEPAASLPRRAQRAGVPLAIVNAEPTPLDDVAEVCVRARAGGVLADVTAALPSRRQASA